MAQNPPLAPGLIPTPADPRRAAKLAAFDRLLTTMDELRLNCPWDQKQTNLTLRHLTIEETYELAEAILAGQPQEIKKEAGDLMLHLAFYARIAQEQGEWDMADLLEGLCDKLVSRHPHIYGTTQVADELEVKRNWEQLKKKEGNAGALSGVPSGLPALVKAMRIQEKARGAGFDWDRPEQVWDKVKEELTEFAEAAQAGDQAAMRAEFGDILFSLVNYARFLDINPDESLERTNQKFIYRFTHMEAAATATGQELNQMSLEEMEVLWVEAKKTEL